MLILNMSEKVYETSTFMGDVVDVNFRGLPAPPLELLMELCLSSYQWLAADANNILVVHCFSGYSRSAAFMSCFLSFRGLYSSPQEALKEVITHLPIDGLSKILPSQHRYLTYFRQCQQGHTPSNKRLRLAKAMLSGVPCFEEGSVAFRPFLEVWSAGELVYSSFTAATSGRAARADETFPAAYGPNDPCVSFQLPADLVVAGDVLLRVRHAYLDGSRDTALRLAFHTGFTPTGLQLSKHELDGASEDQRFSDEFFVDLVFEEPLEDGGGEQEEGQEGTPASAAVFAKAREVSRRLSEEEEKRKQLEAVASPAPNGGGDHDDDMAALEATLMRGAAAESPSPSGSSRASSSGPKRGGGAATSTAGAEEFRKALAAAAADDGSASAAAPSSGATISSDAAVKTTASTGAEATASGSSASGTASGGEKGPKASAPVDDIDSLFSEFDSALSTSRSRSEVKSEAPPPTKSSTEKGSKDVFADVDDFLKELDSGLASSKK